MLSKNTPDKIMLLTIVKKIAVATLSEFLFTQRIADAKSWSA